MLPRVQRLQQEKEIMRVLRFGRRRRVADLQIIYLPGQKVQSRACVVVSKKISKKAHERNHLRRLTHALLPRFLKTLEAPLDLVIRLNSTFNFKQKNLEKSLTYVWPNRSHAVFSPKRH
ncbi:ribonuclease P protein component [Candidatus Parcubacteria bacterium]|nr:MAG: ribonuclease P protein component [Candidatus Parcubacteria bacterium]